MAPEAGELRQAAMDLLARREQSRRELFDKLRRRFGDCEEAIDAELDRLASEGLQSDERFVESFVRSRLQRRQGPLKLRQELARRGIESSLADAALAEVAGEEWLEAAREALSSRFGDAPPEDRKAWARRARFLQGRGFDGGQIRSAMDASD